MVVEHEENEGDIIDTELKLERIQLPKRKNERTDEARYYFCIKQNITHRGQICEMQANFVPSDVGGYALLDLVFADQDKVSLGYSVSSFTDNSGQLTEVVKYYAFDIEKGIVFKPPVKARQASDKCLLESLYKYKKLDCTPRLSGGGYNKKALSTFLLLVPAITHNENDNDSFTVK